MDMDITKNCESVMLGRVSETRAKTFSGEGGDKGSVGGCPGR